MATDLSKFFKQHGGGGKPLPSVVPIARTQMQKQDIFYFYSTKPNLGFFLDSNKRIQFKGNYYETSEASIAEYILKHYSKLVVEITQEQKVDGTSLKE